MKFDGWKGGPILVLESDSDAAWFLEVRQANLNACGLFIYDCNGELFFPWYLTRRDAKRLAKALRKWAKK